MKTIDIKSYRSEACEINKADDMCRVVLDMSNIEYFTKIKPLLDEAQKAAPNSEYMSIKDNGWFCERCQKEVDGASVKYEETHENCGGRCY